MIETFAVVGLILGGWPAAKVFWMFMASKNSAVKAMLFVALAVLIFPLTTYLSGAIRYGADYNNQTVLALIYAVSFTLSFLKHWPNFPKRKKAVEKKKFSSQRKTA